MMLATRAPLIVCSLLCAVSAQAADWSSNSIGYRYIPEHSEPGTAKIVGKNVLNFSHVSGDKWGSNVFNIDLLRSTDNDPARGGSQGAQEWYGFYKRNISISALSGNTSGYGFAKDLFLTARIDAGAKNTAFAPSPTKLQLGVAAALPVSAGFWEVGIAAYKEVNNNGLAGKVVNFETVPALTTAWAIPIGPGTFGGFGSYVAAKGKDGFNADTANETLLRATYMFQLTGDSKSGLSAGFGLEYWHNKFGCDNAKSFVKDSCTATTPMLLIDYKL
jgi:hypothetical protein